MAYWGVDDAHATHRRLLELGATHHGDVHEVGGGILVGSVRDPWGNVLPDPEAFALFEIEGLTHQEIAELTGAKVETVRTRVHYARKEFERLAAELGVSP